MVVALTSIDSTPYNVGAPQAIADVARLRGEHKMYDTTAARIDDAWIVNQHVAVLRDFAPTANPAGSTIYLPYNDDTITSVRLPTPAPVGVDFFLTANMSGCKFFIDSIAGSNDLMVYHANTHQHGSPAHNSPLNHQSPQAAHILDTMHANAQADYLALPAPNNLVLHNVASLAKPRYYLEGARAEQRKANQGRFFTVPGVGPATPEFAGGCSVFGYYRGNSWRFFYQTWGCVDYTRPSGARAIAKDLFTFHWKSLHNRRTKGLTHSSFVDVKVVDHAHFY